MKQVYIIDSVRTGIGNFGGTLSSVRTDDLAAIVLKKLMERNSGIDFNAIEEIVMGCANQAGEDNRNIGRMALLLAGFPFGVGGETVNMLCGSGMAAVVNASNSMACGNGDLYIAGGVEGMTRGPWVISKASSAFGRDAQMFDSSFGWRFINSKMKEMYGVEGMGETAENLAELFNVNREDQDLFACNSQIKATNSQANGRFAEEIVSVEIPQRKADSILFKADEFIKPGSTLETLAKLKPAFRKDGSVTAGNSSGLNDGAAAILMATEVAIKKYNIKPKARIVSSALVGVEPRIMGIGPVKASQKALQRAGLSLNDIDVIELNEAFAAQSLACIRELGLADNDPRINPNGGAIALGHPLGMTGARLIQTATLELQNKNKRYALCTLCVGVGQGYAVILEKV